MSRVKLLLDVIEDMRSLSESLRTLAEAMAENDISDNAKPKDEKTLTLEEVRAVLADKSRSGYSSEVRELLKKHGADRLSEIDPSEYVAVAVEAEVIGSE